MTAKTQAALAQAIDEDHLADDELAEALEKADPSTYEDVLEEIIQVAHTRDYQGVPEGKDGHVRIDQTITRDAANHTYTGNFQLGGRVFAFVVDMGDRAGTEFQELRESDEAPEIDLAEMMPVPLSLAPRADIIAGHAGREAQLLSKWDGIASREPYASLPRKYSYDRSVQPGVVVESFYRGLADRAGFVIVPQAEAEAIRAKLEAPEAEEEIDAPGM